ncbi:MAG: cytochrome c3 family protein, partial [Candidatus Thorarchaeota archaeon]
YWHDDPDTWVTAQGESGFCGSCHDGTPGNTKVDGTGVTAYNVMGNGTTYGFLLTGHGKVGGNFIRLSWQDMAATGNPVANRKCSDCHELTTQHFNSTADRLKAGYENDANNSNCKQCHDPGTAATGAPDWYTTYGDYQNSAHSATKCTECHEVHGASGAFVGMTKAEHEDICYQCHTDGVIENNSITLWDFPYCWGTYCEDKGSHTGNDNQAVLTDDTAGKPVWTDNELVGRNIRNNTDGSIGEITANTANTITATLSGGTDNDWDMHDTYSFENIVADDIEEAFGKSEKHDLGTSYMIGSSSYSLECVTCHNVHIITGKYWEADQDKSPVTQISKPSNPEGNLEVYGDDWNEKMDFYAGGGTYRTPKNDPFTGDQLPDYATFCLECHGESIDGHTNFGIDWSGDMHGQQYAGGPGGYGVCPNWYGCGKGENWDQDNCRADDGGGSDSDCWPVIPRGRGDQIFTRAPYVTGAQ